MDSPLGIRNIVKSYRIYFKCVIRHKQQDDTAFKTLKKQRSKKPRRYT